MHIQVPIRYLANGRKAENRINSSLPFQELLTVELVEIDAYEAPITALWDDTAPPSMSSAFEWGPAHGEAEHVRCRDDVYWRPLRRYELDDLPRAPRHSDSQEEKVRYFAQRERYAAEADISHLDVSEFFTKARTGAIGNVLPRQDELNSRKFMSAEEYFESVRFSFRDKVAKPIFEAAKNLVVIDGMMYVRCLEPCYAVMPVTFQGPAVYDGVRQPGNHVYSERGSALRIVTGMDRLRNLADTQLFPLQNFKNPIQYARRLNAIRRQVREFLNETNAARVPQLMSDHFNEPDNAFVSEAGAKLNQFLALQQAAWVNPLEDTGKLRLFCDLKEAAADFPSEKALELLETSGAEWLEAHAPVDEWNHPETEALRSAVDAVTQRPVAVLGIHSEHAARIP